MRFETHDLEYTCQILKRRTTGLVTALNQWVPCGNTTFIVHGDPARTAPVFDYEAWTAQKEAFRHQLLYGVSVVPPTFKVPPITF